MPVNNPDLTAGIGGLMILGGIFLGMKGIGVIIVGIILIASVFLDVD